MSRRIPLSEEEGAMELSPEDSFLYVTFQAYALLKPLAADRS